MMPQTLSRRGSSLRMNRIWPMNTSLCWLHRSCLGLRRLKTCLKTLKRYFTDSVTLKDVIEDVEQKVRPIRTLFMHVVLSNALIYGHVRARGRTAPPPATRPKS